MNTNELRCILTRDQKTRQQLVNVFALDEFKQYVEENGLKNGIYICNDQAAEMAGNRWFLFYSNENKITIADSLAKSPKFYSVDNILKMQKKPVVTVPFRLQSFLTDVCGEYTIFFSYLLTRGNSLKDICKHFSSSDYLKNDEKVRNFVHKLFPGHSRTV